MNIPKVKVVIIFPKYNPDDSSHYPYWYPVFDKAGKHLDLVVLFETGKIVPQIENTRSLLQKWQIKPFNIIERFFKLLILRLQGYQNYYIHYSEFGFLLARIVTWLFGGKVYLWDCEYYKEKPHNKFLVWNMKHCDVLVTGHEKIAKQYLSIMNIPNKPYKIVNNWVKNKSKIKAKRSKLKNKIKNILFVHHLSPRKGSQILLKIIEGVLKIRKDVQFTIVGNGPDFVYLNDFIAKYNLKNEVKLKGQLSHLRLNKEFEQANIFIMPSLSEGFPRVILEAQSFGVPFVAFDVGCVKEISPNIIQPYITNDGYIKFVELMETMLNLRDIAFKKISKELILNSKQFSLDRSSQQFCEIFYEF